MMGKVKGKYMKKERIEVLDPKSDIAMSYEQAHKQVIIARDNAIYSLYIFCKKLKEMKDSKLYLSAGYESFNAYAEEAVGLKKTAIYDYLQLSARSEEFMKKYSAIGVSKLNLLTKMTEEEATSYIEENNIADMSYRAVKENIKAIEDETVTYEEPIEAEELEIIDTEEPVANTLGEYVRIIRLSKGIGLREMARMLGVVHGNVYQFETNKGGISKALVFSKVVEILELTPEEVKEMHRLYDAEMLKKKKLSTDLADYISTDEKISKAIILAKEKKLSSSTWDKILKLIEG